MNPKISIIVPIYNVEEYLEECLESIINQTYKNLEVILIDDGSTDKSGEICDKYSKNDDRVKVFHQENKGVAESRNVGLSYATGEYIGWVDSDDIIDQKMYEVLLKNIMKENAEISCCNHIEIKNKSDVIIRTNENNIEIINSNQVENLIRGRITSYLWEKLFKRELFKTVSFPKQKVGEDFIVLVDILTNNPKTVCSDGCYYYYRIRNGSSFNNTDIEGRKDMLKSDLIAEEILKRKKYNDKKWINYKMVFSNLVVYTQIKEIESKEAKLLIKEIRKNLVRFLTRLPRGMSRAEKRECLYALAVVLKLR